ncbi:RDD family protein [Kribbella sp. NBC_00709]|uniref:RDD family protein n=1 Tax=Kribbella sp. NBC_00709 TaxID=2975972 RepID=UPI002E29E9F8|nr:RDD family protein [Kribbella sp. NBC_00709]
MAGPNGVLGRLAGKVTSRVVETVQPDLVLSHVDLDALLDRMDVNRVLDRIDVDRLIDRIDLEGLIDRIDVERLMDRVDVERLLERVDLDLLVARIDIESLVRRSGLPEVVVESQTRLAGSVVDLGRRQLAGLDAVLNRGVTRMLRREPEPRSRTVTGQYAGAWSRATATALDLLIIATTFTIGLAGVNLLTTSFWGLSVRHALPATIALGVLAFCYAFGFLAVAGRTPGQGVVGLRVVRSDGGTIHPGQALRWVVGFPLSVVPAGLGFVPIIFQREHRALHDLIAGTTVVYDWGERPAELPGPLSAFLARQENGGSP